MKVKATLVPVQNNASMPSVPRRGIAVAAPKPPSEPSQPVSAEVYRSIDRMREALNAQVTGGISPAALALAYFDWSIHLAVAPGKRLELADKAARKAARFFGYLGEARNNSDCRPCIEPLPGDNRFTSERWKAMPYCAWAQAFLLTQQWWHNVTNRVPGVAPPHEEVVSFITRQILDVFSPSNNPFTNPDVIKKAAETGGANFVRGYQNWLEDVSRVVGKRAPVGTEKFAVGKEVAVTPGKVIYRNHLIELIQFSPATKTVIAEPVLIVPAWFMKYYILDLSPHNSLIRYLVEKGYTVFCISWRNPTEEDRDLGMDDYREQGVMAALDAIGDIVPGRNVHATGYCLGGTLLSVAAATMARAKDDRLATITLLATQTDFAEPGELELFIDYSQMHYLDSMMWNRGYLSADQMAGAFSLLRSNDLIWSRLVHDYLMGERTPMIDLMAWNADSTRMPYRMHSEYLRHFYLENALANGALIVDGHPAALQNIRVPMFVVVTERDHVAPWRSVYKIHYLADTDLTFLLASGGHNAGIVSEPDHPRRRYRVVHKREVDPCIGPDEWAETAEKKVGSWWIEWEGWLGEHSSPTRVPPPGMGAPDKGFAPVVDAPGTYVLQR